MKKLTLMTLFLNRASLQIQDPARIGRLLGGQLFAHLFDIVWMQVIVKARAEPVALALVKNRSQTV